MRHVAAISRPAADGTNAGQLNRSRSMSVSVEICGSEKSQVPPASHAYPSRQFVIWSADVGRFTSAIVVRFNLALLCCLRLRREGQRRIALLRRSWHDSFLQPLIQNNAHTPG